ncbi:MAG: alpha/beta hydrolase [Chloroflexi bacterium]|nr:alpha/beta hydrolase [Chloroflexota bacterium]
MPNTAPPEDKWVKVNSLNLHYLDWGGAARNVLLLLHGQGSNAHSFDHIAPSFRDDYRVLALDQRGHGDSDHTRDGYAVTAFASDIARCAEALGIIPFDLVGASLGARNAIPLAGEHAGYLKHFVCVDYGPEMDTEAARAQISRQGAPRRGWRSIEEYVLERVQDSPRVQESLIRAQAPHNLRLNYAGRYVAKSDPELFWINGGFGVREVPALWEQWARIQCPVLEIKGALSNYLSPAILERMRQLQPTMELVEAPNSGHGVTSENPDFLIRQVQRFLKRESPVATLR